MTGDRGHIVGDTAIGTPFDEEAEVVAGDCFGYDAVGKDGCKVQASCHRSRILPMSCVGFVADVALRAEDVRGCGFFTEGARDAHDNRKSGRERGLG